jgi:hypothetical protein
MTENKSGSINVHLPESIENQLKALAALSGHKHVSTNVYEVMVLPHLKNKEATYQGLAQVFYESGKTDKTLGS